MKAVVAAFNQEKALVGAFSVITNLRMELFEALMDTATVCSVLLLYHDSCLGGFLHHAVPGPEEDVDRALVVGAVVRGAHREV